jgi:uncharacterized protein YjlB
MDKDSYQTHLPEVLKQYVAKANVAAHPLEEDGPFPNNARVPLLLYQGILQLPSNEPARIFEDLFRHNGWHGAWRNGIYGYHHYHSTAHEVLGVYSGTATVQLGGPNGITVSLQPGDVVIIPAGVAHKNLGSSPDFGVVGAYPAGQEWDMQYGRPGERPHTDQKVARVPVPSTDPIYGPSGPLTEHWSQSQG